MEGIRLRKVKIENYRGIKELEISLSDTTVLIGENNTGKTSIMEAIRTCLRVLGSRRGATFELLDFYLDNNTSEPKRPIIMQLTFSEDVPMQWNEDVVRKLNNLKILQVNDDNLNKVTLRISVEFDPSTRDIKQNLEFLNIAGDPLVNLNDSVFWAFQREITLFYLPALRSAKEHFEARGPFWAPFLKDSELTDEQRVEIEKTLKEANDMVVNSHKSFGEVSGFIGSVSNILPLASSNAASIDAVPSKMYDILRKAQVNIGTVSGAKIPVGHHGEGTQSLSVLMLFSAFLKTYSDSEAIVALEEPEAHLHPSAVRTMWKVIEDIPGQRLISTHSGDLLSQVDVHSIRRLSNESSGVTCYSAENISFSPDEVRMFGFHVQKSRGELLFANAWLLVEGETENWIFGSAARASGIDLNKESIRIVEYANSNVGMLAKLANTLGIPWYCVMDGDDGRRKYERKIIENLGGAAKEDRLIIPYWNIETHLLENGFESIYSKFESEKKSRDTIVKENDPNYWKVYAKTIQRKTSAAVEIGLEIERLGNSAVTQTIKDILDHVVRMSKTGN